MVWWPLGCLSQIQLRWCLLNEPAECGDVAPGCGSADGRVSVLSGQVLVAGGELQGWLL